MKKAFSIISLLLIVVLCISCKNEQESYRISANLIGFSENSKVVLSETETTKILDSTRILKGAFQFEGQLETTPNELSLVILPEAGNDVKFTSIFIGNETVQIDGTKEDFPAMLKITGSHYQKLKSELDQSLEPYNGAYNRKIQQMIEIRNANQWNDSLQTVYWGKNGIFEKIDQEIISIKKAFIEQHINTMFGLKQLSEMKTDLSRSYVSKQFERVNSTYKTTKYAKALKVYLTNKPLKKGDKFYNFKAENQNGQMVSFSNFFEDNQYVLLEFYTPHCRWCKMALPEIKLLADAEKDVLKVVTFYVDKNKEDWLKTNEENNINWPSLWDKAGRYGETFTRYGVKGTPTYYLFDNQGKMVDRWEGFNENTIASIQEKIK